MSSLLSARPRIKGAASQRQPGLRPSKLRRRRPHRRQRPSRTCGDWLTDRQAEIVVNLFCSSVGMCQDSMSTPARDLSTAPRPLSASGLGKQHSARSRTQAPSPLTPLAATRCRIGRNVPICRQQCDAVDQQPTALTCRVRAAEWRIPCSYRCPVSLKLTRVGGRSESHCTMVIAQLA